MYELCAVPVALIAGSIFVYWLYGRVLLHHITDDEILETIGFDWKSVREIQDELIATYSNKFGEPLPRVNSDLLYYKLKRWVEKGWVERMVEYSGPELNYLPVPKYRCVSKRPPTKRIKRKPNWMPRLLPITAANFRCFFYCREGYLLKSRPLSL
jgi:hypothetical protein